MSTKNRVLFVALLLLGLGLRLYRLGEKSFWLDEIGVALAAKTSLEGAVQIARSHVAAMPLDYVVAWGVGHLLGDSEFALRLAPALWGTLSLIPIFELVRMLADDETALLTLLFSAISPIGIAYSQELRFYAPLMFFYALVSYLALKVVSRPGNPLLLLVFALSVIGAYFHIFVLLALLNGLFYAAFIRKQVSKDWLIKYALCLFGIALLVLPGYAYFGVEGKSAQGVNTHAYLTVLLMGFSWLPYNFNPLQPVSLLFNPLCGVLSVLGWLVLFAKKRMDWMALLVSGILQAGLIVFATWQSNYFLSARNILFLSVLTYAGAAHGVVWVLKRKKSLFFAKKIKGETYAAGNKLFGAGIIVLLMLLNFAANREVFYTSKGDAKEASAYLVEKFQPGNTIWMVPENNVIPMKYYLEYDFGREDIASCLVGVDARAWQNAAPPPDFLILDRKIYAGNQSAAAQMGFTPLLREDTPLYYVGDVLLVNEKTKAVW